MLLFPPMQSFPNFKRRHARSKKLQSQARHLLPNLFQTRLNNLPLQPLLHRYPLFLNNGIKITIQIESIEYSPRAYHHLLKNKNSKISTENIKNLYGIGKIIIDSFLDISKCIQTHYILNSISTYTKYVQKLLLQ